MILGNNYLTKYLRIEKKSDSILCDILSALTNFISAVILKLLQVMKEDADRQVVMIAIDTTFDMLDKIGLPVIQVEGVKDAILTRMKEAFTHKVQYLV